ncbi:MAG: hypothetical protein ACLFWM_04730 [Actinomycetota bacterium]
MRRDGGFASLQFVLAAALAMFMVVGLVQLVAYQYTRGAVMASLERGARAGSIGAGGAARCEQVVRDSLGSVLDGAVGASLRLGCADEAGAIRAWAEGAVPSWVSGAPDMPFSLETRVREEPR